LDSSKKQERKTRWDDESQSKEKRLDKLKKRVSRVSKDGDISATVKIALVQSGGVDSQVSEVKPEHVVPQIEWWDEVVLSYNPSGYDSVPPADMDNERRYDRTITRVVQHPERVTPPDEKKAPTEMKTYLTKKETKKLRRDNRRFALKERTEKIRLGLEKPPEPKVKLSNLMRVLAMDHVQDPTKVEASVRKQVEERRRKHEEENAERKLKKEERKRKHEEKNAARTPKREERKRKHEEENAARKSKKVVNRSMQSGRGLGEGGGNRCNIC